METIPVTGIMGDLVADVNTNFSETSIKDTAFKVNVNAMMTGDVIVPDGSNNKNFFDVYLNRAETRIAMPVNFRDGEVYRFQIRQDGTGGRELEWGTKVENTGLTCSLTKGSGSAVTITITAGIFDWTQLHQSSGRQSFIHLAGFNQNANNIKGIKLTSFDESAGTITFNHPFCSSITDESSSAGHTINYENKFYFTNGDVDDWIGTNPYAVTQYSFYTTTDGASGILTKEGVLSNSLYSKAKARNFYEIVDDFIAGNDDGQLQWSEQNTNGQINTSSSNVDGNHFGTIHHRINNGNTSGRTNMRLISDGFQLNDSRSVVETVIKFDANYFSQSGMIAVIGWNDGSSQSPISINDGYYFEIVSNGDNTGRVCCITTTGGTKDEYDTGIDIGEDEWCSFTIQMSPNFTHIHFYVNDYEVLSKDNTGGTLFTTAKVTPFFGSRYSGDTLTANREFYVDLFSMKYRMNSDRI